jgi:hypothetical protein
MLFVKSNKLRILNLLFTIFTIFITTVWVNFYYIATKNADFNKYYDYLNYFLGADVSISYGQGTLYYFIVAAVFKRNLVYIEENSLDLILSYSIQNTNLIFYLLGLYGIYKLLKLLNFDDNLIFLALSLFNFFPQSMLIRAVMKPEILAFSFFPWILYFAEKYRKDNNLINVYFAFPFLLLIINSKGSIAGMAITYIVIAYFADIRKINPKKLVSLFLVFFSFLLLIQYENYSITQNTLFDRDYDEKYDNRAEISSIYKLNFKTVFNSPYFYSESETDTSENIHSDSVINSTILDSFGDFYNQFYDHDVNYFYENRKDIFRKTGDGLINSDREILYNGPFADVLDKNLNIIRKTLSSIFSVFFYSLLFRSIFKDKENRKFYIMPFIGVFILYLNSLGFPSNNYNPILGDTYKTFYYSFLISMAFLFVLLNILKNYKILRVLIIIFWIPSIFFIAGHPKSISQEFSEYLVTSNQYSAFCSVNNFIFFENPVIDLLHSSGNETKISIECNHPKINFPLTVDQKRNTEFCFDSSQISKKYSSMPECRLVIIDFLLLNNEGKNVQYPYVASVTLFLLILLAFKDIKFKTKRTS